MGQKDPKFHDINNVTLRFQEKDSYYNLSDTCQGDKTFSENNAKNLNKI